MTKMTNVYKKQNANYNLSPKQIDDVKSQNAKLCEIYTPLSKWILNKFEILSSLPGIRPFTKTAIG